MSPEEQVVRGVFEAFEQGPASLIAAKRRLFDVHAVWWNSGRGELRGLQAIVDATPKLFELTGAAYLRAEDIRTLIVHDDSVIVERTDTLYRSDGSKVVSVPAFGIVRIKNGKVVEWRDYCDDWMRAFRPAGTPRGLT